MRVISKTQDSRLATVYIAQNSAGKLVEFVESTQPPFSRDEKYVLIVSTLFGCPVDCSFCDAGGKYHGKLSAEEILFQVDYAVKLRFPAGIIDSKKFKIQFSRMGEPSFNTAVLDVLEILPGKYQWQGFIPSLSTIGPSRTEKFFDRLLDIKKRFYPDSFQLQFSIHSTSRRQRDQWMPVMKWDFGRIAGYGSRFFDPGGKKITLNFAVSEESIIDENELMRFFSPEIFLIKLTPLNPTFKALRHHIRSGLGSSNEKGVELSAKLEKAGFEVILSMGEEEENKIGSNCGQYVQAYLDRNEKLPGAYSYPLFIT